MTVNGRRAASVAVRLREQRRGKRAVGDIPLAGDEQYYPWADADRPPTEPTPPPPPPPPPEPHAAEDGPRRAVSSFVRSLLGSSQAAPPVITAAEPRTLVPSAITESTAEPGKFNVLVNSADLSRSGKPRTTAPPRLLLGPYDSREAAEAAAAAAVPPVWVEGDTCARCVCGFGVLRRRHHCRNCGATSCDRCSLSWPRGSLPEAYLGATPTEKAAEGTGVACPTRGHATLTLTPHRHHVTRLECARLLGVRRRSKCLPRGGARPRP